MQVAKIQVLFNQVENHITQKNNALVYLGEEQAKAQLPISQFNTLKKTLVSILKTIADNEPKHVLTTLRWQSIGDSDHSPAVHFINAGTEKNPVYICRAPFMGANAGTKALYPGQLLQSGCRISYAGYAFIISKYSVLSGQTVGLRWIPIARVKKIMKHKFDQQKQRMKTHSPTSLPPTSMIIRNDPIIYKFPPAFDFGIHVNGAMAVSGGYQGGKPVLICRTTYKNKTHVGKLVLYLSQAGKMKEACDIGVADKEIVIGKNYSLLFAKMS